MRKLKAMRLISFEGRASSWSNAADHEKHLKTAKALQLAGFERFVDHLELAPIVPNEDPEAQVKLIERTYYSSTQGDNRSYVMVTDEEYNSLIKCGVVPSVSGIYQQEVTPLFQVVFWAGLGTFIAWNLVLLLKVSGVL